jgi:hypothetical protein
MEAHGNLIQALVELAEFMNRYELSDYANTYLAIAKSLQTNDKSVNLDEFFESPYVSGGMGTVNDVIISRINGNPITENEESGANQQLRILIDKVRFELRRGK